MDSNCRYYQGAVAIVTGGASGIGRALAETLATRGAMVILADRQLELAADVANAIEHSGGSAVARELDVRDASAVTALVQSVAAEHGRLDFIFNNAGIGIFGPVKTAELDEWLQTVAVNLNGVIHGVAAAHPIMVQQGFGHIVNTASMAGLLGAPGLAAYTATKHAVVGLSKCLRYEGEADGVRVSVICPGVINTPILQGGKYGKIKGDVPEGAETKAMDPNELARGVLDDVARQKFIIIYPRWWRLLLWMERLTPALYRKLIARFD